VLLQALISYLKGEAATVPQLDEHVPLVPFEPPAKRQKVGGAWQLFGGLTLTAEIAPRLHMQCKVPCSN
jgi:hypothetical protein